MMAPFTADVFKWEHLPFPKSLPQFQKLFPTNDACARYLEGARWPKGFECPHCGKKGEPFRFEARPGVLRCRDCREANDPKVAEEYLPIIHLAFSNLKSWLRGTHHGVSPQHLQAYLNEFAFRFNRRFYPFNAFRSLLGIGANGEAPTYDGLYSGEWKHPTVSGHG